MLKKDPSMAV